MIHPAVWPIIPRSRPKAQSAVGRLDYRQEPHAPNFSRGRSCQNWNGLLQADAFSGYNRLYAPERKPRHIVEALCCSDTKRKFSELADIAASARRGKNVPPISPIALETVARIDAVFSVECDISGASAVELLPVQRQASAPLFAALGI